MLNFLLNLGNQYVVQEYSVATSWLALCWMCDSPPMRCVQRIPLIYMWCEQATLEWSWHVISVVACCYSVNLSALAAQAFQSQKMVLWPGCEGRARCSLHKKNLWSVRFNAKGGDVVATSPLVLCWKCNSPQMGCVWRSRPTDAWHEQATLEWSWHVVSIVVCCQCEALHTCRSGFTIATTVTNS